MATLVAVMISIAVSTADVAGLADPLNPQKRHGGCW